jgi:hypothetical protein
MEVQWLEAFCPIGLVPESRINVKAPGKWPGSFASG